VAAAHAEPLLDALCAIRRMPPANYSEEQWTTLRNVFTVLRQAVAELKVVFAEHNQVDFTELSLAAIDVLQRSPERVLEYRRQHSPSARRRVPGHFAPPARTGPPRFWPRGILARIAPSFSSAIRCSPSYMFRQAEVELFTQVREHGIGTPSLDGSAAARCSFPSISARTPGSLALSTGIFDFDLRGGRAVPVRRLFRSHARRPSLL